MSPRGRPRRADVYARFEAAAADLARLGGLPSPVEAAGIWDDIWHLEAHNSTAIEGNTLILREVEVLLDTGRAVGAKELRDYLESRRLRSGREMGVHPGLDRRRVAERGPDHRHRDSAHSHGRTGAGMGGRATPGRNPGGKTGELSAPRRPPLRWRDDTAGLDRRPR